MTTLKEETIKGILAEGAFDMSEFGDDTEIKKRNRGKKTFCGTSCCVAGHIVAAAARLKRKIPTKTQLRDAQEHYCQENYVYPAPFITTDVGTEDDTAMAARAIWARSYGKDSAANLDFYATGPEMQHYVQLGIHNGRGSFSALAQVPAEAAVAHLERVTAK